MHGSLNIGHTDDGMNGYSPLTVREAGDKAALLGVSLTELLGL